MTDVFISYSREDKQRVRALVAVLEAKGYDVWWDHDLVPGQQYASAIERELLAARCVLAIWSERSIQSQWVRDEAAEAARLDKLIPITLDSVMPPLGYRQVQAADLTAWDSSHDAQDEALVNLLSAVRQKIAGVAGSAPPPRTPQPRARVGSLQKPKTAWVLSVALALAAITAGYLLYKEHADRVKAQEQATNEARRQAELEAKRQADLEAKRQADLEAKRQAELEARQQAELEAKRQAELEAKRQADLEAKRQADLEAKRRADLEAKRRADLEAQRRAELEAQRRAELEAQRQTDLEAKRQADLEARRKARLEAERLAAIEASRPITIGNVEISSLRLSPAPPAEVAINQAIKVTFRYAICCNAKVRIWVRPDRTCPASHSPSPIHTGTGSVTREFTFSQPCRRPVGALDLVVKDEGSSSEETRSSRLPGQYVVR